ncbi:MAG: hypothetical protein OXB84_07685, partial [Halobacteriovoraceae bacterium]|nr:hypothetical protein [Halobacteriovoraceae bacterium]
MRHSIQIICLSILLINACGKEDLVYYHEISNQKHIVRTYPISGLGHGSTDIILVFDVSGSMSHEIGWVAEAIGDALITLTTTYFKVPWKLAILGSSVATISTDWQEYSVMQTKDILGKTTEIRSPITAMNFVGFPKESILEWLEGNGNEIDDETSQAIYE